MKRWMQLMAAASVAIAVACGSDVSSPVDGVPSTTKGLGGGPDSTKGGGNNGNGPVASVTIDSPTVAVVIPAGFLARFHATARNAGGHIVAKPISWRSSDTAVAIATDTGVVFAVAVGTAKIYASVDGHTDSATVTVIPAPPPPPPPPGPVAEFNMTVVAMGPIPGTDTSRTERVAGATVTLMRIGGINGDTLTTPVNAGTAVTNANGEARFTQLVGGSYSIRVTPPASSPYAEILTGIGPPRVSDFSIHVTLPRK